MFGNSKEYQDLKKLYEERVSKPEQIDEGLKDFVNKGGVAGAINRSMQKNEPIKKLRTAVSNIKIGSSTDGDVKVKPFKSLAPKDTSSEIKSDNSSNKMTEKDQSDIKKEVGLEKALANKKNLQKIETKAVEDKKDVDFNLKNTESSEQSAKAEARPKRRPVPSPMEAGMGSGAARARAMARKRIAAKKANPDQKQLSGRERAQAIAKARLAKKAAMEEYTPYDIVLEYLLSTEQVATIEEANYVMTEMDAETIQGIVEEQKKNLDEGLPLLAKGALVVGGAVLAKKGYDKAKERYDKFLNNQRNKSPFGGNKRVDDTRQGSGDKKVGEKIYYGK